MAPLARCPLLGMSVKRGSTVACYRIILVRVYLVKNCSIFTILTLQKVNASVKKSDQDLDQVNSSIDDIREASLSFAPSLRMDVPIKTLPSKQAAIKEKTLKKQPAAKPEKTSSGES